MSDPDRRKRAEERRKTMTIRRVSREESDIDFDPLFGLEGMALASEITKTAWAFSRRSLPSYKRSEIPVKFVPFDSE